MSETTDSAVTAAELDELLALLMQPPLFAEPADTQRRKLVADSIRQRLSDAEQEPDEARKIIDDLLCCADPRTLHEANDSLAAALTETRARLSDAEQREAELRAMLERVKDWYPGDAAFIDEVLTPPAAKDGDHE